MSFQSEAAEVQAATLLAAALLLASGRCATSEDAATAARCLLSVLKCELLQNDVTVADRPF
jgi:hypothetical protein